MAVGDEAVTIELLGNGGDPVRFTCADATGISAGCIMALKEPRTAIAGSTVTGGDVMAGIACAEKEAGDGATSIAGYTHGIFDMKLGTVDTVQVGDLITMSGINLIAGTAGLVTATQAYTSGLVIGKALETGSASEVIAVLVGGR